eukprot:TRINITY_DN30233_c0_g2_i1.p2 TRINITY_DN30233_c0_g2~~TRINITY_DN30233_c0_g2_i1.p2  ORF type:complete len:261 (-),score=35.04 TRINITY_DN30233_c0_g2_i1:800-1582(-)
MDVAFGAAKNLSKNCYVSIRAGEHRKQVRYQPGERFHFDLGGRAGKAEVPPRHVVVDVFEKVATKQISLSEFRCTKDEGSRREPVERTFSLDMLSVSGASMSLDLNISLGDVSGMKPRRAVSRHETALKAKDYLERFSVQKILQDMVQGLISEQPSDPISFMTGFVAKHEVSRQDVDLGLNRSGAVPCPERAPSIPNENCPPSASISRLERESKGRVRGGRLRCTSEKCSTLTLPLQRKWIVRLKTLIVLLSTLQGTLLW